ncbi:MAG: hypothetical protein ACMVY4_09020 [Minwuia sp.]|uniref:hypothetical protein n=1 Tax=Minwuia sp. TaxID=2493630 RepID=UPI003A8AB1C3
MLVMLFAPALPSFLSATPVHHDHSSHGVVETHADEQVNVTHDRLSCSIVIPCDHGF